MPPLSARQFRARLKDAGISQQKFALWLGIHYVTVNRWANGHVEVPRYAGILADLLVKHPELFRQYPNTAEK
jgi:DNA-binding transcriptional regulator YiaG